MSKRYLPFRGNRSALPSLRGAALTALASVSLAIGPAVAQTRQPLTRPLVPFMGESADTNPARSITLTGQDAATLLRAVTQRDQMPTFGPKVSGAKAGATGPGGVGLFASPAIINSNRNWVATGPVSLDTPFTSGYGSFFQAGRVNQVAWDMVRRDASGRPNILYIATASGGLWRATIDYSTPQAFLPQPSKRITDPLLKVGIQPLSDYAFETLATSCIAIHPTNTRILYVGTGDFTGDLYATPTEGIGIMKSVNDGRTWVRIGDKVPGTGANIMFGSAVSTIVIDPNNPRRIVAASGRGSTPGSLWLSEDEGNTWR